MRVVVLIAALLLSAPNVRASMPGEGLTEEGLLHRAIEDIGKMNRAELAALVHPLSACASLDAFEGGLPRYYCHKELITYRASGSQHRAVEALIGNYYAASRSILLKGKAGMLPNYEHLLMTYLTILEPLVNATALRSKELSRQEEQLATTERKGRK